MMRLGDSLGTSFAHITDAHVTARGRRTATLKHRSVEVLRDLIAQTNALNVDCVLFGGDNIDNRGAGTNDVEVFLREIESVGNYASVLGNHEAGSRQRDRLSKRDFASAVAGQGGPRDHYCFSKVVGDVHVIGIDTTLAGTGGGHVSNQTMHYLATELHRSREAHVVILGHHLLHRAWEPHHLQSWDDEYLVSNRHEVISLLASHPNVRAYLCGHHHASRIQRIASRGHSGGFYHILTASPVAFPHTARVLRFAPDGIHVNPLVARLDGLVDEGRDAVLTGRKARRYGTLGTRRDFLQYVAGRSSDNDILLPYDRAPESEQLGVAIERRTGLAG